MAMWKVTILAGDRFVSDTLDSGIIGEPILNYDSYTIHGLTGPIFKVERLVIPDLVDVFDTAGFEDRLGIP